MGQLERVTEPSLLLIIPYFGAFPPYVSLFFESCAANPTVNWLLVTDQSIHQDSLPKNVRVKRLNFSELVAHISQVMGFEVTIPHPYKLCDFKPAYGLIFEKDIEEFEFWGHCDMDMIFGNLKKFLTRDLFYKYDKLLICGHLSIYRNSLTANNYFRLQAPGIDYRVIFASPYNKWFDEWRGIAVILKHHNVPFFDEDIFADIDTKYYDLRTVQGPNYKQQIFYYEEGGIYKEYWDGTQWGRREYAYIHLQKRLLHPPSFALEKWPLRYFITPKGFVLKSQTAINMREVKRLNPRAAIFQQALHSIRILKKRVQSHF